MAENACVNADSITYLAKDPVTGQFVHPARAGHGEWIELSDTELNRLRGMPGPIRNGYQEPAIVIGIPTDKGSPSFGGEQAASGPDS